MSRLGDDNHDMILPMVLAGDRFSIKISLMIHYVSFVCASVTITGTHTDIFD
jgi:hypothetical protein